MLPENECKRQNCQNKSQANQVHFVLAFPCYTKLILMESHDFECLSFLTISVLKSKLHKTLEITALQLTCFLLHE